MNWLFRCYVRASERNVREDERQDVVDEWIHAAGDDAFEAALDTRLKYLAQQPRTEWKLPYFRLLHGPCIGLGEVRFKHASVQQRLLGAATGDGEYTWLLGAIEKGGKFVPKDACETALKRLAEVKHNRSNAHACDRD